jgi:hypothetical protein
MFWKDDIPFGRLLKKYFGVRDGAVSAPCPDSPGDCHSYKPIVICESKQLPFRLLVVTIRALRKFLRFFYGFHMSSGVVDLVSDMEPLSSILIKARHRKEISL